MFTVEIRNKDNGWRWVHHMKVDQLSKAREEAVKRRDDCGDHSRVRSEGETTIYLLMTGEGPCGQMADMLGPLDQRLLSHNSEQMALDHQYARSELLASIRHAEENFEDKEIPEANKLEFCKQILLATREYLQGEEGIVLSMTTA
jgi:hypothetical protein